MTGKTQPSGLSRGLPLVVNAEWTPGQAAAVFELLDDLRDAIWNHYAPDIQDLLPEQRSHDHRHQSQLDR